MTLITLPWHGMACPACHSTHNLRVEFQGLAWLTDHGSEDDGDHEWDGHSMCYCRACYFQAPAMAFEFGEEGAFVEMPENLEFKVMVVGMTVLENGDHVATDALPGGQRMPDYVEVTVLRNQEEIFEERFSSHNVAVVLAATLAEKFNIDPETRIS